MIIRAPRPDAHFLVVHNTTARDARLSYRARGLLVAILSRPDDWRTSSTELAREATEGREAVRTALRELEALGYIRRRKYQDAETGRWLHDLTVFDTPQSSAQESDDGFPGDGEPGDGEPGVGNLGAIQRTETKDRDEEPTRVMQAMFDEFWEAYPRKVAKPAAWLKYKAAHRKVRGNAATVHAAIMAGLGPWLAYWQARAEPGFVTYPATWLHQERWNDDPGQPDAARAARNSRAPTGVDAALAVLADLESQEAS